MIAPLFGSFTQSAFAQNVGLVAVTGVKSRYVVAFGGLILIALGLAPVMGRVVACIPAPVLGGAGIVLFGTVAASGIRTLARGASGANPSRVTLPPGTAAAIIPFTAPRFCDAFPAWFSTSCQSGISSAAVAAIIMNLAFNHTGAANRNGQPASHEQALRQPEA